MHDNPASSASRSAPDETHDLKAELAKLAQDETAEIKAGLAKLALDPAPRCTSAPARACATIF